MATRSLGTLTIDLVAKTGGFVQGMDKAAREADKRFKEIEKRAKMVGAAIGTALVAGAGLVANQLRNTINQMDEDRKSTRLNSSHVKSSYAVFCLKKKMDLRARHHRAASRALYFSGRPHPAVASALPVAPTTEPYTLSLHDALPICA